MNKIRTIYLSYWFHELSDNPAKKVYELEDEVRSIINEPLMYSEDNNHLNLIIPRIQGMSTDKKYLFTVSYINAILTINIDEDIDNDEAILLINNNLQLFYDIVKRIFDVKVIYSSIKIEMVDDSKKAKNKLINLLKLKDEKYENMTFKCGFIKDNYYVNYALEYNTEYSFNFDNKDKLTEDDLFNKSMVTSLEDASLNLEYLLTIIEVNDRYSYNMNRDYETNKDELRGMIMEIKNILNNKLYEDI